MRLYTESPNNAIVIAVISNKKFFGLQQKQLHKPLKIASSVFPKMPPKQVFQQV